MLTAKIDAKGHWLRADAAASYLRMVKAAGTAEGLVVGGRTYAEQKKLYDAYRAGRGNLAAKPGTSLHETGLAIDVTRKSPLQLWMVHGSDPMKVTVTGTTRAAEYGWLRTVPSEAWHFSYDPKRDKHVNDDYTPRHAEPAKPAPKPTPKTARVTVMVANCQSYDGDRSEAAWRARAQLMAELGADVVLVQETTDAGRKLMCKILGPSWKYYSLDGKTVAIMVNTSKLKVGKKRVKRFGTPFGHGAIALPLTPIGAKSGFDAICQHTRPGSVATDKQKASDVRKGASLAGTWPAVLGGDFALNAPSLPGWTRTTPKLDSMDKAGVQSPDAIYVKGKISASKASLFDPGKLSDHKWAVVSVEVSA